VNEYTPSPTKVRNIYKDFGVGPSPARRMDEFDRMIREVRAEAWEEGYVVGCGDGFNRSQGNRTDNPYKEQL
jgi:hypothetical protein